MQFDILLKIANFNSRTHVECDLIAFSFFRLYAGFQLTHSRGVRPVEVCCMAFNGYISTHALTWSATETAVGLSYGTLFQLTHSRGVRRATITVTIDDASDFNSRTHVECDARSGGINYEYQNFNSRTHVECDTPTSTEHVRRFGFQLTHSRGVRLGLYYHSPSFLSFQLTHSRGVRRLLIICVKRWTDISTHALTWSATRSLNWQHRTCRIQLTHSRGGRLFTFSNTM